jgi:hypothetical protein
MQMDSSEEMSLFEKGKKARDDLGTSSFLPEEVATANIVQGRRARGKKAEQCAAKIDVVKAVAAASLAERKAREAARIAKAKAEEVEEAWRTAKAKAEEAARIAETLAEEAVRATEAADEARRLKDRETEWAQCEEESFACRFRPFWNRYFAKIHGATFHQISKVSSSLSLTWN